MNSHPLQQARETNIWYPFDRLGEWSLAKFLIENLSQMQIDKFLKLDWFWTRERPQFKSKDELFFYMQQLPGYDAWEIQNQLPEGVTIILIIAASDKTLVTRHTGGLEMHLLFLTIGNIQADFHMKATLHVWQCTAFMPIPAFIVNSDFQSLLQAHLWHKCMDLICSNLKIAAHVGKYMVDPSARQTETYILIQQLCNCVDLWDLIVFIREAKKLHLSGIMGHELDVWFKSHHKHTGVCHFSRGVSHCMIVPTLWGMASPGFIYFHDNKQAILDADAWQRKSGAKDDFFIPKLELMQSFAPAIFHVGSLMQWTADISEHLLITHCKHPFECTSHQRDFVDPLINAIVMEDEEIASTETDPTFTWVSNANPAAQLRLQAPHPETLKADCSHLDISQLQSLYNIPDFSHALHLYASHNGCIVPSQLLFNTWWKFQIQLYSMFHTCRIMPSQQIHADPPSPSIPRGNCDTVLFNQRVDGGNDGASDMFSGSHVQVPKCLSQVLVYIQHFDFITPDPEPSTGMWMPERVIRHRSIIPLADITHAVEIIPVYQGSLGKDVNSGNSLEVFEDYFLNNFADKELYHSLLVISDN
ncbi:hypothetical protein BDR04DRAFT_1126918 [Suillus decipiens]|nr:hypothetical protein BDR04DRAFT_1126918 [Suillus decipiens]